MFSKKLKGKGVTFNILENFDIYRGRTFGDWTTDWWNWVISEDPDYWQTGPVHFLSPGFARDDKGRTVNSSQNRSGKLVPGTFVTKTEIVFSDQAILLPVLNTMVDSKNFPYLDSSDKLRREARGDNDASPPLKDKSFTVDKETLFDGSGKDWNSLRVESPVFTLRVPDVSPGVSNKDRFDIPLVYPGEFNAVADGYWVFIQNLPKHADLYSVEWFSEGIHNYTTGADYEIKIAHR
jgi:hypothetical protein